MDQDGGVHWTAGMERAVRTGVQIQTRGWPGPGPSPPALQVCTMSQCSNCFHILHYPDLAPDCPDGACTRRTRKASKLDELCSQSKPRFYIRLSCWSFNTLQDFTALSLVFNNNLKLSSASCATLRHQFLHTFDL